MVTYWIVLILIVRFISSVHYHLFFNVKIVIKIVIFQTNSCPTLAVSSSELACDDSYEQIEEKNTAGSSSVFCASAEDLQFSEDKKM